MRWFVLGLLAACGCDQVFGLNRPDASLVTGLVAWYPMEELVGGTLPDIANHHDATCLPPACPHIAPGVIGHGLAFDGTQALTVTAPELSTPTGFTVTMWVAIDQPSPDLSHCPANKRLGSTDEDSWQLCFVESVAPFPTFYSWDATTGDTLGAPDTPVDYGVWHHVAIRWDGSTKTIFLDGEVRAAHSAQIAFDSSAMLIGSDIDNGLFGGALIGRLDELQIYDHSLRDIEIAALATH